GSVGFNCPFPNDSFTSFPPPFSFSSQCFGVFFCIARNTQSSFSLTLRGLARKGQWRCFRTHAVSPGSQLCPPGHGSDHPRRVSELDRLRHLRRLSLTTDRGEAAPRPQGLPSSPIGRTQAVRGEPQSLQPRQNPVDWSVRLYSHPSCGAGPPPLRALLALVSVASASAEGPRPQDVLTPRERLPRRDPRRAGPTRPSAWRVFARRWLSPISRDISSGPFVIRITKVRYQCLRPDARAPQRPVKLAVPPELPVGLQSAVITWSCRQCPHDGLWEVPRSRLPRSRLIPRRGKSRTGGRGQTMVRSLAPAVLSRGSRRGQNPQEAPLVRLRDAPDTQLPPVPLRRGSVAGRRNITKYMPLQAMPTVLRIV
ncbi:hypothetical protein Nmel_009780, partial [Mimus melanotis]